ncbi:hypothetical protein N7524_002093 [Penicillium chrysogenum]|nr:hypothetical protein N7524_002093 [Penicillium chrysogenum]
MNTNPQLSKMQPSERLPSYEETTKVSKALVNEFISGLEAEQSRNSFLIVLLNRRLGIDDKCKAIEDAHRIPAIEQDTDAESVEDWLRLRGMHKLAQSVCYYVHTRHSSSNRRWCKALIEADIEIRWIVQRMIWVHQQKRNMGPQALDGYLKSLKQKYWRVHRKLWIAEDIDLQREHSHFKDRRSTGISLLNYAKIALGGGGCCGRACGCCEIPRTIDELRTEGMRNRGHCTSACSCCLDAHELDGKNIGDETTDLQGLRFDTTFTEWRPDPHTLRLLKGYVFSI